MSTIAGLLRERGGDYFPLAMNYSAVANQAVNQIVHVDGHARVLSLNKQRTRIACRPLSSRWFVGLLLAMSCEDAMKGKMPGVYTLLRPETWLSSRGVEAICAAARQADTRAAGCSEAHSTLCVRQSTVLVSSARRRESRFFSRSPDSHIR